MSAALLERKELIQQYLREAPGQLSSFSFTNIFTWQEFFQFELEVIDGNLCVFARHEAGTFLYLPPLGKNVSAKTIEACFERMDKVNRSKGVSRVETVHAHQLALSLPRAGRLLPQGAYRPAGGAPPPAPEIFPFNTKTHKSP